MLHTGHCGRCWRRWRRSPTREVRERLEADLLAWVAGRSVTTPAQLAAKIGRELLARDVRSAARELEAALRRRGVRLRPDRVEGMAVLEALLTVPEAAALLDALGRYADALDDGPGCPGGERRRGRGRRRWPTACWIWCCGRGRPSCRPCRRR